MGTKPGSTHVSDEEDFLSDSSSTLHVTALDALVNVNSFFTGAVFIGLTLNNDSSLVSSGQADPCNASEDVARRLVVFEVVSFAFYLLSSLIAQGLKLQLALIGAKKIVPGPLVPINGIANRMAMLATAVCTIVGSVFLLLSMVGIVELRLGVLNCQSSVWSKVAAIPLVVCVSAGIVIFSATVVYSFLK